MVFMKAFSATAVGFALLLSGQNPGAILPVETALSGDKVEVPVRAAVSQNEVIQSYVSEDISTPSVLPVDLSPEELTGVVQKYCVVCHNDVMLTGNLTLAGFDVASATVKPVIAEKMIVKLRAGMMPIPGAPRPSPDTLLALVETLETIIDDAAAEDPNPGSRTFQRLNRAEYAESVKDLLDLDINAGDYLPLDTKSANFDNIADVQMLSPTLLGGYLSAAGEVSRLAVGDPQAPIGSRTYTNSGYVTQWDRVEGAPRGTRGGISVMHNFLADGEYVFKLAFEHTTTGGFYGRTSPPEQIELSIDGERMALLEVDKWMHTQDPNGVNMETEPIYVPSGPHRVSAAFLKRSETLMEDLVSPHEWSLSDRQIGVGGYGVTAIAHLKDLGIHGPYGSTGVSDSPSRRAIFTCRPVSSEEARPCAREIVSRLADKGFRRPVSDEDVDALMSFYEMGGEEGGFEGGIGVDAVAQIFEHSWESSQPVSLDRIVEVVCNELHVTRGDLAGRDRGPRVSLGRGLVACLARRLTDYSYPEIARTLARRNHSSAHAAARRIEQMASEGQSVRLPGLEGSVPLPELLDRLRHTITHR